MPLSNLAVGSLRIESGFECQKCNQLGIQVKNITVQHMVKDEYRSEVGLFDYYLCMNKDCDVSYYNPKVHKTFFKDQIRIPLWFKKDANPRYACYCSKVTEQDVIDAVVNEGATTMKEVLSITGAMKISQCQKMNPLGKCCHQIILEAMKKGKDLKKSSETAN